MTPRRRVRALRSLGRALGGGPVPAGRDLDDVVVLARGHGLTPALHLATVGRDLPALVRDTLDEDHRRNVGRTMRVREQLHRVVDVLGSVGIEVVLLKGAAHLAAGAFSDPAVRVFTDLDLLVDPSDVTSAVTALERAGYQHHEDPWGLDHHDLAFEHDDELLSVELHQRIGRPTVEAVLSAEVVRRDAVAHETRRGRVLIPAARHAALHHVLHSHVQDRHFELLGVPVRQLHTAALLADRWRTHAAEVAAAMEAAGLLPVLWHHEAQLRRLFGSSLLPGRVPARSVLRSEASIAAAGLDRAVDAARNLAWAFDEAYLSARYGPARGPVARGRRVAGHLAQVARSDGPAVVSRAFTPKR